jgi:hypothetical protein
MNVIPPTPGRIIWIRNREGRVHAGSQPETAIITYVWNLRSINVHGWDANGEPFQITSLVLVQPGDSAPDFTYAEWMPFQIGQAAKTEALQAAAAADDDDGDLMCDECGSRGAHSVTCSAYTGP